MGKQVVMLTQKVTNIDESSKRECWLVIGSTRVRIPRDIHSQMTRFCQRRRYSKSFDGLLYAASIGFTVLEMTENVNVINVTHRDEK